MSIEKDACGIGFVASEQGLVSREIVDLTLEGLANVEHRQARAADGTGDGAGVLLPLPKLYFAEWARKSLGHEVDPDGVGVLSAFLDPKNEASVRTAKQAVGQACSEEDIKVIGWREVPTEDSHLGGRARASKPNILQAIMLKPEGADRRAAERGAYRARRRAEAYCQAENVEHYFPSWSFDTVVYKGMVTCSNLGEFYPDLKDNNLTAPFGVFHSRFSTNTMPSWRRVQPFRYMCHNGEINTVRGNERNMGARALLGTIEADLGEEALFHPLLDPNDSDSGKLDRSVELLTRGGRDIRQTMAMLIPEAWENNNDLDPNLRDFYRYHASVTEPWDGPAGIIFTDGVVVGARLDRGGLRPLCGQVYEKGLVVCASEFGVINPGGRRRSFALGPGEMVAVDPSLGGFVGNVAIKRALTENVDYEELATRSLRHFSGGVPTEAISYDEQNGEEEKLLRQQWAYGVTREEMSMVLTDMAKSAKEPTGSMGDDTPFPALSNRPHLLYDSLYQMFAQVSNPPIDSVREQFVMSLRTVLGPKPPLLRQELEADAKQLLELDNFFLYPSALDKLTDKEMSGLEAQRLSAVFSVTEGPGELKNAINILKEQAASAVENGASIIMISDADIDETHAPVPSVLALGAVHNHLIEKGLRRQVSLVVDSGDARDTHSLAMLITFGADAICPRLALRLAGDEVGQEKIRIAMEMGVLKIMSKMGIATIDGYRSAQVCNVLGLGREVVDMCLTGTNSAVGGLTFDMLASDILKLHHEAFSEEPAKLLWPGEYRAGKVAIEKGDGIPHANSIELAKKLQRAVGYLETAKPAKEASEVQA